jgi:histidinol-phosphate aminotransferase
MNNNYRLNPWFSDANSYAAGVTFEELMAKYGFKREEILRLAGNESTIGISPKAIKAAQEALLSSNYYDEPNCEELMDALIDDFKDSTPHIDKLGFVIGNGMDKVIEHILCLSVKAGDTVINFNPTFDFYSFCTLKMGGKVLDLGREPEDFQPCVKNLTINIDKHEAQTGSKVKLMFLCTPNNPTGNILNLNEIEDIANICEEKGIILFVDHAYIEFTDRETFEATKIIHKYPHMVIGYTFSKAYALAGYRVGYALMHQKLKDIYLKYNTPFLCAKPSLQAAKAAIRDSEHFKKIIENNNSERPKVSQALSGLGFKVYSSYTNFVLFEISENLDEQRKLAIYERLDKEARETDITGAVMEYLFSKGIILRRSKITSNYAIRMTIGTEAENQRVLKALAAN